MNELYLIVSGKVQGIFFRATVKEIAEDLNLCGYAKNLNDGTVEIVVQGTNRILENFLEIITQSPGRSKVSEIKKVLRKPKEKLFSFRIL